MNDKITIPAPVTVDGVNYLIDEKGDTSLESGSIVLERNRGAGTPYYRIHKKGNLKTLHDSLCLDQTNHEYWIKKIVAIEYPHKLGDLPQYKLDEK